MSDPFQQLDYDEAGLLDDGGPMNGDQAADDATNERARAQGQAVELPSPKEPMRVARRLAHRHRHGDVLTLRHWRGGWQRWQRTHWAEVEDRDIESWIYNRVEHAFYLEKDKPKPWAPTRYKIADVIAALRAVTFLPATVDPPVWLPDGDQVVGTWDVRSADQLVAVSNGILHLNEPRMLLDHNPQHFTQVSVPFDYDPEAGEPTRWLDFLAELWPDDAEQIQMLQEWFGYVISGSTRLHKILLLVGPPRSGKGTIGRILTALVGRQHVTGPTLASLSTNFGLQDLVGKPLAIISDARLGRGDANVVVERLLSISGEDFITVDRKYRDPWTGKLGARFMLLSNELPRLGDASAAIATRMMPLILNESFLGKENPDLTAELETELPAILNWALEGLDLLNHRGRFTEPTAARDAITALEDLASPVGAFIRDQCTVDPTGTVPIDALWNAWKSWCEANGQHHGTKQTFGRNLKAKLPRLRVEQPRAADGKQYRQYIGLTLEPPQ